jgi:hypothetical protein
MGLSRPVMGLLYLPASINGLSLLSFCVGLYFMRSLLIVLFHLCLYDVPFL